MNPWPYETSGIPDHLFSKGKSPITREEIRAIIMDKLRLVKSHTFLDVGAGTGAVTIEASRIISEGQVFAIEAIPDRVALIAENLKKFAVNNVKVLSGTAPEVLTELPMIDRVFIGGSGGKLGEIIQQLIPKIQPAGRIVITAVTLETLQQGINILSRAPFNDFEGLAINFADLKVLNGYHLFESGHSIYVLAASID